MREGASRLRAERKEPQIVFFPRSPEMERGRGRENGEEDKGTKERKRSGKDEGAYVRGGFKSTKGRGVERG